MPTSRAHQIPVPNAGVWPDLETAPSAPIHSRIARILLRRTLASAPLTLTFPDGSTWGAGGPELQVANPDAFFARIGKDGLIGFGEAWMTGDLTSGDWPGGQPVPSSVMNRATDELAAALTVLAYRIKSLIPVALQRLRRFWQQHTPHHEENTTTGAEQNIRRHYDLSNDLFELFLDPTMSYSAADFTAGDTDLHTAQLRKIDSILDYARVGPGSKLVEIGSGWGALAIRAAQRGADVTTLTLSIEQKALADKRIVEAGVADRVRVLLTDYRLHAEANPATYDSAVSVEMIEAVGEKYWPTYFSAVDRMLIPGAAFGLQAITIDHDRLLATRGSYTWIHKYIFPGGILPSMTAIEQALRPTHLRVQQTKRLGPSYATTLERWRHRFNDNSGRVRAAGFDETFLRMWNFYLAYSEAGFRSEYIDDWQLQISPA